MTKEVVVADRQEVSFLLNCIEISGNGGDLSNSFKELALLCKTHIALPVAQRVLLSVALNENREGRYLYALQLFRSVSNWDYAGLMVEHLTDAVGLKSWHNRLVREVKASCAEEARTVGNLQIEKLLCLMTETPGQEQYLFPGITVIETSELRQLPGHSVSTAREFLGSLLSEESDRRPFEGLPGYVWIIKRSDRMSSSYTMISHLATLLYCQLIILDIEPGKLNVGEVDTIESNSLVHYNSDIEIFSTGTTFVLGNITRLQLWSSSAGWPRFKNAEELALFSSAVYWNSLNKNRTLTSSCNNMPKFIQSLFGSQIKRNGFQGHLASAFSLLLSPKIAQEILWNTASQFHDAGHYKTAIELLESLPDSFKPIYRYRRLISAHFAVANFETVLKYGKYIDDLSGKSLKIYNEAEAAVKMISQLKAASTDTASAVGKSSPGNVHSKRVVSVLHASAPYQSGGYANRAHGLLAEVAQQGFDVRPYTRPGFPETPEIFVESTVVVSAVGNLEYVHGPSPVPRVKGEYEYMLQSIDYYLRIFQDEKPDYVHLRSTYVSALPALIAAKTAGVPCLYEISGMWELVYEGFQDARRESLRARTTALEQFVCTYVDRICTVTEAMKSILVSRGITESKISLVPNAVDTSVFYPVEKDESLLDELGWSSTVPVIGYLGSFVDYEGLDVLVRSLAILRKKQIQFRAILVGDGSTFNQIRGLVTELGLNDYIHMPGRVGHQQVPRLYSIVDVCPFPRLRTPATEAVSPLKPFEAMASGKAVIVSDLPALSEIVGFGSRGFVCQSNNVASLANALIHALGSEEETKRITQAGHDWTVENRTWKSVGRHFTQSLESLYENESQYRR